MYSVEYKAHAHSANSGTFTILDEGHTIGNMITVTLQKDPNVHFASYNVPPSGGQIVLKVR